MAKNNGHNIISDEFFHKIYDMDLLRFFHAGKKYFLVDLDGTIVSRGLRDLSPRVAEWVQKVRKLGGDVVIVSNTRGRRRIRCVAKELDVDYIRHAKKPEPDAFRRAAGKLNAKSEQCVVVGDKSVTDVSGGKNAGMYTVQVEKLTNSIFITSKLKEIIYLNIIPFFTGKHREVMNVSDN